MKLNSNFTDESRAVWSNNGKIMVFEDVAVMLLLPVIITVAASR